MQAGEFLIALVLAVGFGFLIGMLFGAYAAFRRRK